MLLRRFTPDRLSALLVEALEVDKALKGVVEADGWRLLEKFMLTLAGYRLDKTQ